MAVRWPGMKIEVAGVYEILPETTISAAWLSSRSPVDRIGASPFSKPMQASATSLSEFAGKGHVIDAGHYATSTIASASKPNTSTTRTQTRRGPVLGGKSVKLGPRSQPGNGHRHFPCCRDSPARTERKSCAVIVRVNAPIFDQRHRVFVDDLLELLRGWPRPDSAHQATTAHSCRSQIGEFLCRSVALAALASAHDIAGMRSGLPRP